MLKDQHVELSGTSSNFLEFFGDRCDKSYRMCSWESTLNLSLQDHFKFKMSFQKGLPNFAKNYLILWSKVAPSSV